MTLADTAGEAVNHVRRFGADLLDWYAAHGRSLPWRGVSDPYAVWVSEMMLQQTQVETVIPYYLRWLDRFPNVGALAAAQLQDVLSVWEGLGYYARARSLHRAAQIVLQDYAGCLPQSAQELQKLPGIGRYTAGAIASIAFGVDAPALDGNIRRVFARLFDITLPIRSSAAETELWRLAEALIPPGRAGDHNQALMELGATLCSPRAPSCPKCPLNEACLAYQRGVQAQRPVKAPRPPAPHITVTAAVIRREAPEDGYLIALRPPTGLLANLWEFPGGKLQPGESLAECLRREICEELDAEVQVEQELGVFQHAYTHFRVTLHAFDCHLTAGSQPRPLEAADLRWVRPDEMPAYPMGKIDRQISLRLQERSA